MPTVIDALLIDLGLDSSDFIQKSQAARADMEKTAGAGGKLASETEENFQRSSEASVKHSKNLEAWGKSAAESLGKLRDSALGLFAVFTAGKAIDDFAKDTTVAEAAAGRLAKNLNIPVKTLSEWQQVMQAVGGSIEDANSSLQGMQGLMAGAAFGNLDAQRTISILGIDAEHENASEAMVTASRFFSTHSGAIDQQIAAQAGMSTAMMNFLEEGPAAVQKALAAAAPTAMTAGQVQHAQDLQAAWAKLENTLTAIGRTILDDLDPGLQTFLGWLQRIADWGLKHPEEFGGGVAAGGAVAGAVGAAIMKRLASWILGRGGATAGAEAAEATEAAEVVAAGGTVALSPALAAALAAFSAATALTPGTLDPGEEAELNRRFPNRPRGQLAPLAPDVEKAVRADAVAAGLDPDKIVHQFQIESGGYDNVSPAGAFGPAQLEPGTAKDLGVAESVDAPDYSWQANAAAGVKYMAQMVAKYPGDYDRALVAYNWGPANADNWDGNVADLPAETQKYLAMMHQMSQPPAAPAPRPAAPDHTGEYQSALTGQWTKLPPIVYEPALPQGVVDLMNQMRVSPPSPSVAQMIAHHRGMTAAAASVRHTSTTNHGPVTTNNTHSAETHVHSVVVNTKATNADGIARSMGDAIKKNGFLFMNTNRGLA